MVLLSIASVMSLIPVVVTLRRLHQKRGFDVVIIVAIGLAQIMYKTALALKLNDELFLTENGWHKMLNIFILIQYCSLMTYLARVPKERQGYVLGFGTILILLTQEKDYSSFLYALIPLTFNNVLLVASQCSKASIGIYVNTRMVFDGIVWYILSMVALVGAYHELFDFYYVFQDLTIFCTGLSLFYSWQTYEKYDVTLYQALRPLPPSNTNEIQGLNERDLARLKEKSLRKQKHPMNAVAKDDFSLLLSEEGGSSDEELGDRGSKSTMSSSK